MPLDTVELQHPYTVSIVIYFEDKMFGKDESSVKLEFEGYRKQIPVLYSK